MAKTAEICHIHFPRSDFNDASGCLKSEAHNDHHICRTDKGALMAWEDDYDCDCGCWDDEDDLNDVCRVYWEVKSINE